MKPTLKVGNTAELTALVTEDMCPAFDGVIVHRVYSTWSMAHHMEVAARKVLAPHLDAHEEGIGSHISIDHLAPTPVGRTVRIVAQAVEVGATTLVCEVKAYDGDRLVGQGRQIQRILPKKKLQSLIERAKMRSC
ncbi:MAG: thioesterase [Planctomycetes bacterium]|nr:thioesterase [Planctomycetota bacterium]